MSEPVSALKRGMAEKRRSSVALWVTTLCLFFMQQPIDNPNLDLADKRSQRRWPAVYCARPFAKAFCSPVAVLFLHHLSEEHIRRLRSSGGLSRFCRGPTGIIVLGLRFFKTSSSRPPSMRWH